MDLQVHIPATSSLGVYINSIWEIRGKQNQHETILPQGIVEMIFNLGDSVTAILPSREKNSDAPLCFIQGVNTEIVHSFYNGQQHLFGIRLQPDMVKSLLGILPSELKNTLIDLTLIKPGFRVLWHQLKEAASFEDRVNLIQEEFPILSSAVCLRTQNFCRLFMQEGIQHFQSMDSLSRQVFYSSRHLNRKAQSLFGISAEELITYKKFLHAVKLVHNSNDSLTSIAYEAGFYDQAHFSRTFKSYAGITPRQYRQHKSDLPFHLFSEE